jgi:hypothetical protein
MGLTYPGNARLGAGDRSGTCQGGSIHVKARTAVLAMLAIAASAPCVSRGARAIVIDTFDAGALGFVPPGSTAQGQVAGAMLGGERDESVTNTSATGGILAGASGGAYGYGAIGATGSGLLTWDGADASAALDPLGLGGVDFTESGAHDAFSLEILANDLSAPLVLTVYTSLTDFSQITVATSGGFASGPPQTLEIPFASFTATGAGADFANVGALTLLIDGLSEPQLDVTLGSIATSALAIPDPGTFGLLGFGLVLLASGSRGRYRSPS